MACVLGAGPTVDRARRIGELIREIKKRNPIEVCLSAGLIVGMGEESADLIEVAFKRRELEVPSIPVNFLIPIAGNQVQHDGSLTPDRCLRALCLMHFVVGRTNKRRFIHRR